MKELASLLTDQRLTDLCPPMIKSIFADKENSGAKFCGASLLSQVGYSSNFFNKIDLEQYFFIPSVSKTITFFPETCTYERILFWSFLNVKLFECFGAF